MSNLKTFDNLFANLSQAAYENKSISFSEMKYAKLKKYEFGKDIKYNGIITKGGENLENNGVIYLQPDETYKLEVEYPSSGDIDSNLKGVLSDQKQGFNAYFLTDTPQLSNDTQNAYIAVKGSDGFGADSLNDWIGNDIPFVLIDVYTSQGQLTEKALHEKLAEMREKAPNAKLNGTKQKIKAYKDHVLVQMKDILWIQKVMNLSN